MTARAHLRFLLVLALAVALARTFVSPGLGAPEPSMWAAVLQIGWPSVTFVAVLAGLLGLRWGAIVAGVQLLVGVSLGLLSVPYFFTASEPEMGVNFLVSGLGLGGVAVGLIALAPRASSATPV